MLAPPPGLLWPLLVPGMSASGNDGEVGEDSKRLEMCVLPVDSCEIADMVSEKSVLQHNVLTML